MLKRANINLDKAVDDLRNALFTKTMEEPQTSFKTREVYEFIRRHIISPQRALVMAKNIFLHGDFKRLRENIRRYKKDEQTPANKFLAFYHDEKIKDKLLDKKNCSRAMKSNFNPCVFKTVD